MKFIAMASALSSVSALAFMSEIVDTVEVVGSDGKALRINADEFDGSKHTMFQRPAGEVAGTPVQMNTFTAPPVVPLAASAPVIGGGATLHPHGAAPGQQPYNPATPGEGERPVALAPAVPPASTAAQDEKLVSKTGNKFFVVNKLGQKITGQGFNEDGYKSNEEAWAAINPPAPPAS